MKQKQKSSFEDIDDRIHQMLSKTDVLPMELRSKIQAFEVEYSNAEVTIFKFEFVLNFQFDFQNRATKLDLLWGVEQHIRREFNYQKSVFARGKRIIESTLAMESGKTFTFKCNVQSK